MDCAMAGVPDNTFKHPMNFIMIAAEALLYSGIKIKTGLTTQRKW
jgi:hypothetical protein